MNVTTVKSEKVWVSKDSDRTIWEVTLKGDDGKEYKLKTYSSKISEEGYKGEVRSYVNPKGDRFVRQVPAVPKPDGFQGRDDSHIRAQWAIGQASQTIDWKADHGDDDPWDILEERAEHFFLMADRVKHAKPLTGDSDE
jgi:hypothetical protein